ncbi:phage tail tube protein [Rhizobium sp. RU36D]|uniref:phage tail tube protein n=1 Tax=Rhizobium sp. RU36D TaxID=1907415 RepID=UPI0009D8945A|nr:phage tail tube protein [Rhizobium sp. RU36D]SMD18485.1 Phage tail tube protein [Rhizobium sp. RU36D]
MSRDFGGRISMRLSTGELISLRGTLNMSTSGQSNEAVTNSDGTVSRIGTPKPRTCEITFEDGGIDHDALMKAPRFNVTIDEDFTSVQHFFPDAFVVGDPMTNRMNGEVTGLTINSASYTRTG